MGDRDLQGASVLGATAIVMFVQVSESNYELLPDMFGAIWHPSNTYIVHYDAKLDDGKISAAKALCDKLVGENVVELQRRNISWGGISVVMNVIQAMEQAMKLDVRFSHFVNLSPSHFPLVSPQQLRDVLLIRAGSSFGHFESMSSYHRKRDRAERLLEKLYIDPALYGSDGKIYGVTKHPFADAILKMAPLVKGESWLILSEDTVQHIVTSTEAKLWMLRLAGAHAPDEWVLQNIIASDEPRLSQTFNDNLQCIIWRHPQIRVKSGSHPLTLNAPEALWPVVHNSSALFARKFDGSKGSSLMKTLIKQHLWNNKDYLQRVQSRISLACAIVSESCRDS
eukprot:CAMPEP_0198727128 /NCGR_PEP_ID=MMETSP1475-20131203/3947_1 /TAXON_ID= ORGANISM="Unidentified sp., Strain CCMP1999" /NCGR_SAMPLE_ID=MMETSP1475 /ASSEMBLY_ACC=CAM_ASM_001111 /LENGTH=338 /DNA_ID=CAMNT_0044489131 /DNA_START=370 /DNA_END=1383 /DNA_ORIENTATION=+